MRKDEGEWNLRYEPIGTPVPATGWQAEFELDGKFDKGKVEAHPVVAWVLCNVFEDLHTVEQSEPLETKQYPNKVCGLVDAGDEGLEVAENLASRHFMTPDWGLLLGYYRVGGTIIDAIRRAISAISWKMGES